MKIGSIRGRIALLTGGILAVMFVGYGIFLYASLSVQLHRSLEQRLRSSAEQLLVLVEAGDGRLFFDRADMQSADLTDSETFSRLVSPDGEIFDQQGEACLPLQPTIGGPVGGFVTVRCREPGPDDPDLPGQAGETGDGEGEIEAVKLFSLPVMLGGAVVGYLQVGQELEPLQETLQRLLALLLLSGPVLVLLGSAAGYWLAGQTLAPMEAIRRRAASISARDLSARLDFPLPDDEVGRLARTFNEMLMRLEESFQRQRRFTADASHELRTPLAVIRGEVDVTLEHPRTAAEYQESLRSIGGETDRMTRLVNDLMLLARSDVTRLALDPLPVDLADLLHVLVDQVRSQRPPIAVEADLPEPLPLTADPDRLLQLFINLLDNAAIHAPGSRVTVWGRVVPEGVEVRVADSGPGIDPEHLPRLFERFYRVDPARSRGSGGSGLGLAIAQEIVQAHGGTIRVESTPGEGTTFSVRLPQSPPDPAAESPGRRSG